MKYCARCGGALVAVYSPAETKTRLICNQCQAVAYQNPRILVTCLVEHDGRLLLCQRRDPPGAGLWTPPAGFMELGETLEQAAVREIREETGVSVDPAKLDLHIVSNVPWIGEVYVGFRSAADKPDVAPGPECLDARFFPEEEIPWDHLAFPETSGYLRLFLHERRSSSFGLHLTRIDGSGGHRRAYAIAGVTDIYEPNPPTSRPQDV